MVLIVTERELRISLAINDIFTTLLSLKFLKQKEEKQKRTILTARNSCLIWTRHLGSGMSLLESLLGNSSNICKIISSLFTLSLSNI
jgi:hypothetical protein